MKRTLIVLSAAVLLAGGLLAAQSNASKNLDIYVIDVEGGKSSLYVAPGGQTVLIDAGNPVQGTVTRDADRIMEVAQVAGVTKLDYLLTTHYHVDHVGNLQEIVKRLPVGTYVDHGPTSEEREQVAGFQAAYAELYGKAKHLVPKVGDTLPIPGVNWRIVTSNGEVQKTPIAGAQGTGPNANCAGVTRSTLNNGGEENDRSLGSLVTFGGFRLIDLGDFTGGKEFDLMCPNNPIGAVDVFFASNHGTNNANFPFFTHSLAPRVSIAQNAAGKGASLQYLQGLYSSPGFGDVWLLHWANGGGLEWNPPGAFIANGMETDAIVTALTAPARGGGGGAPGGGGGRGGAGGGAAAPGAGTPAGGGAAAQAAAPQAAPAAGAPVAGAGAPPAAAQGGAPGAPGAAPGGRAGGGGGRGGGQPPHTPAYWLKISVAPDGSYTVTNSRNNFSKTYQPRAAGAKTPAATPARGAAATPARPAATPAAPARPATPATTGAR